MKYNKKIVYESVYKCDICGKRYVRPIGVFKLRGLELRYEQKREQSPYNWMFAYKPLTRIVRRKIDVCSSCASKIDTYINELYRTKGKVEDNTFYI